MKDVLNLRLLAVLSILGSNALMAAPAPDIDLPKRPVPSDIQDAKIAAANAKRARKAANRRRSANH